MQDWKQLLKSRLQASGAAKGVEASAIVLSAQQVFDEQFGAEPQLVRVLYLKNRTLTVSVSGAPVAQEIKKNENELLKKIRQATGEKDLERLRYLL